VGAAAKLKVLQDVTVVDVVHEERSLYVTLQTGDDRTGIIEFLHDDERARDDHLSLLRRWMHLATPVTYVSGGGNGTLIDDRVLFARALRDVDPTNLI
jgi:hypothetical protein